MALLVRGCTGESVTPARDILVGRAPNCDLKLIESRVSAEHARLRWDGNRWVIRDLGSRNGTIVDGESLAPGADHLLTQGAELKFGCESQSWNLADSGPPVASATHLRTGRVCAGEADLLQLHSGEHLVCVRFQHTGWWAELPDGAVPVRDQDLITVYNEQWTLHLPERANTEPLGDTAEARRMCLGRYAFRFQVSSDHESVSLTLLPDGGQPLRLPERTYYYALLLLARARLRDRVDVGLPEPEHGWQYTDALARDLASTPERVNVDVHRMRKQLAQLGLEDAANIVERRRLTGQLRLGVSRVEIV
jgi:FHA domain